MSDYIIGADIGTSSSKATAFSLEGKLLAQQQIPYPTQHVKPSYSEQDPDQVLQAICNAIRQVTDQMQNQPPLCVSFSSAMHSLMAVDSKGDPLSPLILWSDGRSEKEAEWLKQQPAAQEIYLHTGTPIHPMSPLCKLIWWRNENKKTFGKTAKFIGIKEYLFSKLFGEYVTDYSLASATGLFDHYALKWYEPALELSGLKSEHLPDAVSSLYILKGLKNDFPSRLGLPVNTPFVAGAGDGCLANLGTGVTKKEEMAVTIGTSGAVRLFTGDPINDEKGRIFNYLLLPKEFISGGAVNNGGVLLDWFRHQFMKENDRQESYDDFLKEAFDAEPGCNGLLFLPYLMGERSPMWDSRARGAFLGIHIEHERKHFMRAVLEGICYSLYDTASLMERSGLPVKTIYASGGFTRNPEWVQMLTDLFDKKVRICDRGDASSVGAALLGMRAMGILSSWEDAEKYTTADKSFVPDKKKTKIYQRNFELFSKMYDTLKTAMHEITTWQNK